MTDNDHFTRPRSMDDLERRFRDWALERRDVDALVVVGSRARDDHPADEWADLDLGVVTTNPARYANDADWLREIAETWVVYHDPQGASWHVLFAGGLDAGVAPIPASMLRSAGLLLRALQTVPAARHRLPRAVRRRVDETEQQLTAYCGRGVRTLVDKRGRVTRLLSRLPVRMPPVVMPSREDFDAVVQEFWFVAVWNAKHLRRGELWHAKTVGLDGRMKTLLLRMLEWHARATRGGVDTWENGRFLEEWADPRATRELASVFGHYDATDLWRASLATMDLFRWLARETAGGLGYPSPAAADVDVTAWVTQCHAEIEPS